MKEYSTESGQVLPEVDTAAGQGVEGILMIGNDAFAHLPLSAIAPSLTNPRKTFDAVKLAELADSIKASGVHQPILVRPLPGSRVVETSDAFTDWAFPKLKSARPTHEIVAGERRYRACKLAGVATIPALIRDLTDHQVLEIQIIENLQRDDLSPLEEAEGYEHLCSATGIRKEDVGAKIGKSRAYVYARIKLLDLSQDCKQALRSGSIDASRALLIARIPDTALQHKAVTEATRKGYNGDVISLRDLQTWLQKNVMLRLENAPFDIANTQLCADAGSCKTCPKRTGANPDLFADVDGADICTDPPCYQAKEAAHRATLVAQAEAMGMRVIEGKEAAELFKKAFSMGGYSRLDQIRNDTDDSDGTTLRKMLGTDAVALRAQGVELVLIEHPRTKELIEAASTAESEALLITRGLIKQTQTAEKGEREIKRLKDSMEHRLKREGRLAVLAELTRAVHASDNTRAADLITPDLLRAWLIGESYDLDSGDLAMALAMSSPDEAQFDDDAARLRIQTLPTSGLWKALAVLAIVAESPNDYRGRKSDDTPAFDALAKVTGTDIDAIMRDTRASIKAEVAAQIKTLKAEAQAAKQPKPVLPLSDVAFSKGEGGAKTNTKKPKTTAAEAQAAIAAAMQAQDEAQTPESETDSGAAIASQGIDASPVPASGFALSVGTKVRVVEEYELLAMTLRKWAGKQGTVTASGPAVEGGTIPAYTVTFKGRNGGMANFLLSQLEVVPS